MSQNRAPRDDPYQPSTSTASQRRYDANRREFERIFSPQTPPNLWQILTTRQRGRALKANFEAEIRALRGLNFSVLLKPYESYLTDLCQVCSTTFPDLCQQLRHFAFYKRMPCTNDDEDAKDLFQMVATCIHYENMQWKAIIRKRTLLDKITERRLKHTRLKTEEPQPATSTASTIFKILKKSRRVPFNPMDDEHLREQHYLDDVGSSDHKFVQTVDKFMKSVIRNNMANRTKECALSDVEYYCVDDRVLLAPQISFRLDNMLQIVEFKLPAIEDDGYFPPDRPDRAWYLFEQYQKAHFECTSAFSVLRPPNGLPIAGGFERSTIVAQELLYFHSLGRHIHGFHEVWRETERGFQQKDGQWVPRRYLVDIYNQVKFPMYIEWEMWPPQLKWAFDKLSLYSLKLMYMVKKYSRELKSLGDSLFTRYPSAIHEGMKFSIASVKGRQQYLSVISEQNMRINEKCALLPGVSNNGIDEDVRKRKRRSRKSDIIGEPTTPKMPAKPSPRKAVFATSSVASTSSTPTSTGSPMVKTMTLQKENMEKLLPVVPLRRRTSYGSPRRPQFHQQINQQTPPTTAPKRRLEEAPSIPTPPPKKPSLDSWDEHVHNSMEEEHVDEEEGRDVRRPIPEESDDIGGEESSDGRKDSVGSGGEVWVPQDRGGEVAPEQYAREILEHYGVKKDLVRKNSMGGEIAAATRSMIPPGPLADLVADISVAQQIAPAPPPPPPPPLPAQKQRRSRKTNNAKLSSSQEFLPENLAMPSSSMECLVTPTPPTPTPSSPIPPTNGGGGGGAVTPRVSVLPKQHRVYSLKPPVPKFPVKKVLPPPNGVTPHPLLSPQNANSSQTITIRNAFMTKRSPVIPQQQSPQFLSTFPSKEPILQQKQPYYRIPTTHTPLKNGVVRDSPTSSALSSGIHMVLTSPPTSSSSSSATSIPLGTQQPSFRPSNIPTLRALPRTPIQSSPLMGPPRVLTESSASSPTGSQSSDDAESEYSTCHRAMPFNEQMVHKNMQWDPQNNKKFQRSMSAAPPSGPPRTPYRPRSFSNNHNGTPARAPPSPPTVARVVDDPIIPERSIPVAPKIRQTVPWTAPNNRYHHPIVTSSFPMSSTTFTTSPVPLLPFPAQMALVVAPPPVGNTMAMMMPAMVVASPAQLRTTTTAYTVMDSSQQIPSPAPTSLSAANSPAPMPISIRTYTNHLRKSNPGTLTPEELGDALRSEHQRFHDTRDGEGPSVKSFLLNLHQK